MTNERLVWSDEVVQRTHIGPAHSSHPDYDLHYTPDGVWRGYKDAHLFAIESIGYGTEFIAAQRVLKVLCQCELTEGAE